MRHKSKRNGWALLPIVLALGCGGRSAAPNGDVGASGSSAAAGTAPASAGTVDSAGGSGEAGASAAGADSGSAGEAGPGSAGFSGFGGSVGANSAGASGAPSAPAPSKGCAKLSPPPLAMGEYAVRTVKVGGVAAAYLPGGIYAATSGEFDYTSRPYAVRVPQPHGSQEIYPITFALGGCGGNAKAFALKPLGLVTAQSMHAGIEVALSVIDGCFEDGGPSIGNRTDSPEIPYFRAVLAELEDELCVDKSKVFVQGYGGGAFAANTLGCAASDVIRGVTTFEGGLRAARPQCLGPMAALLVAPTLLSNWPIGPLDPSDPTYILLGSPGSAPGRDDFLRRNGCVGDATEPFGEGYSACVKYTGCPAQFPVVWCPIASSGQSPGSFNGVNYFPGPAWSFLSHLP